MSTPPRDGPFGGGVISSQLHHQPADVTQQPLRSHQLRLRTADGRPGAGVAPVSCSHPKQWWSSPLAWSSQPNWPSLPPYGSRDIFSTSFLFPPPKIPGLLLTYSARVFKTQVSPHFLPAGLKETLERSCTDLMFTDGMSLL